MTLADFFTETPWHIITPSRVVTIKAKTFLSELDSAEKET
jgi:hypothetical protein